MSLVPKVLPGAEEREGAFWQGAAAGELVVQRCTTCGTFSHPPRHACLQCHAVDDFLEPAPVSGRGTVASWAVVHRSFLAAHEGDTPYVVLAVALEEQPDVWLPGILDGAEPQGGLRMGDPVEVVFIKADEVSVPQFKIVANE